MRLARKTALVTGAARGIGAAVARELRAEGAEVVLADIDARVYEVAAEIDATAVTLDVSDAGAWERAARTVKEAYGGPDVLVNNAGIAAPPRTIVETSPDDYLRIILVNQLGAFLGVRAIAPAMRERGGGSIVNISSVLGRLGRACSGPYVATKFAVTGMTKVAALELAGWGIRVNSIHPGAIDTEMLRAGLPGRAAFTGSRVPLRRAGEAAEVAKLAAFLASGDGSYCTGAEFVIDGGQTCGVAG